MNDQNIVLDNYQVVLYNSQLTCKYSIYINIEVCASVSTIKYIYKYIYKGVDYMTLKLTNKYNKIIQYLNSYYISLYQIIWNLFKFYNYNEDLLVI